MTKKNIQVKSMINIVRIVAGLFLVLFLAGCQPVPDSVKKLDIEIQTSPLNQIASFNGQKFEADIKAEKSDNQLHIDANILVPNTNVVYSYEMMPKQYDEEQLYKAFNIEENLEITQGTFPMNVNDKDYEPAVLSNDKFSFYINNKRGQLAFWDHNYKDIISKDNEIPLESVNCKIGLTEAQNLVKNIMDILKIDYATDVIYGYKDTENNYYYFRLAQIVDGIKIDIETPSASNDMIAARPFVNIVIGNEGVVYFEGNLLEKNDTLESYENLISINSAIDIIKKNIDLILSGNNYYERSDGNVRLDGIIVTNNIELIYVPQRIDTDENHSSLIPVWNFESGRNFGTDKYCNIKINAINGSLI